jgi:3-phenylpropionate/cinnamic acid dioxygenase small subunit
MKFHRIAIAAFAVGSVIVAQAQSTPKLSADDYIEIQQLYANYAHGLDEGKADLFTGAFLDDGEFTGQHMPGQPARPPTKGKDALARMGGRGGGNRHFVSNLSITRTPEGANASAYFIQFNTKTNPASLVLLAVYEDTLVKTPQGWKFKSRKVWRDDDENSPFKPNLPQERPQRPEGAAPGAGPAAASK